MGKWSQYRRRGRAAPAFAFNPPQPGDVTFIDSGSSSVTATYVTGAPATVDQVVVRYRGPTTGGDWFESGFGIPGSAEIATGSGGTTVECQSAWGIIAQGRVSDWSASTLVPVSA